MQDVMYEWYQIRVRGELDPTWAEWFEDFKLEHTDSNDTLLTGRVGDQAALYGVLIKLRNLGLELIQVQRQEDQVHPEEF
jgi:hypothetical protein